MVCATFFSLGFFLEVTTSLDWECKIEKLSSDMAVEPLPKEDDELIMGMLKKKISWETTSVYKLLIFKITTSGASNEEPGELSEKDHDHSQERAKKGQRIRLTVHN